MGRGMKGLQIVRKGKGVIELVRDGKEK